MSNRAIVANLYHAPQRGSFEYIEQACIEIDANGTITQVLSKSDHKYDEEIANHEQNNSLTRLAKNQYLLPGLVDLHTHAHSGLKQEKDWIFRLMIG
ncbi:guanine deaminase [Vibrio variabilis]|uniref:Guanine deaminase n=1 Tax=Vibrio variabilis TaxID=990271 RepID=A0ABQ0JHC0_9VIBR|nr:guanine deaminase [Vibrio variabilis]